MFNITRRPDSTNIFIEMVDVTLRRNAMDVACELYRKIGDFLVQEYIEQHKKELLEKINLDSLAASLPVAISKVLIERLFELNSKLDK